jgi:UDP-glucose 4-epimerase
MKTLAITGLFSPLGRHMAQLANQFGVRVLGIDVKPMTQPITGVEFVEADIRNPLLSELFKVEKVDTILHCSFRWRQRRTEQVFDSNVLGTMRLLGAAAMAGVRKVVLPSSTVVYGADAANPTFIGEENDFKGRPGYAYVRELREVETFANGFRRQQPDMVITTLRFANILGGGCPSPLARYLALPAAPVLIGFDPMLQVIHHDDVLRVLGHCIMNDYNGVYNIAASPAMPLLKLLALAQTPPAPVLHFCAAKGFRWGRMLSKKVDNVAPLPWEYLRYSWVASTDRMSEELDFEPLTDAESTVREFGEALRAHRYETNRPYRFGQDRWRNAQKGGQIVRETTHRTRTAVSGLRGARAE